MNNLLYAVFIEPDLREDNDEKIHTHFTLQFKDKGLKVNSHVFVFTLAEHLYLTITGRRINVISEEPFN